MADRADTLTAGRAAPARGRSRLSIRAMIGGLALLGLELRWLTWFLSEPLPNAANAGGTVRRWILLSRALPEVVPGVTFRQSHLGFALRELGHVENLPQRAPIVLAAALIAAAAVGLGLLVQRGLGLSGRSRWYERYPLAYGLGTTGLGLITLGLGRMGWLAPWPIRIGLGGLAAAGLASEAALLLGGSRRCAFDPSAPSPRPSPRWGEGEKTTLYPPGRGQGEGTDTTRAGEAKIPLFPSVGFLFITGPFLVLMALGSMLPTIDFDALEYHLQGPKEYFQAGRIAFLPHNVYMSMPSGVEMLHLLGMVVLGDWWWGALAGQLLVMLFAPMAAALIGLAAARWGSPRAGWVAAAVYLTTPWIYRLAVIPYVEGPLCYFHAALIHCGMRIADCGFSDPDAKAPPSSSSSDSAIRIPHSALRSNPQSEFLLVGLLAGGAMACKYPALVSAVVPFGVVALAAAVRARSWRIVLAFAAGVAIVVGPWLLRNVIDTGNPVYPLAHRVFGGRHWDAELDAKWSAAHGRRPINWPALADGLLDVAGRSDWQSPLYTALVPLALLRPGSRRFAAALLGYAAYLFATWWLLTHRLDRFWLPILPALAILAGLGADWTRHRGWTILLAAIMALSIATNLTYTTTALAGFNEWTGDLLRLRRSVPAMLNPPLARLDAELPTDAKILLVGQASVFHLSHPAQYNTVFNEEIIETLTRDRSPGQVRDALRRLGVTHVYVDWFEIARYRSPGNYGYTDYVTPTVFERLVEAGVLDPLPSPGPQRDLYRVRGGDVNDPNR